MAARAEEAVVVRLRLVAEELPPEQSDGRPTEFGLQDKKQGVHAGRKQPDGSAHFDGEVRARRNPITGEARFSGPFVQGTAAEPFLYLSWRYTDPPGEWKRRQKIRLDGITWKQVEEARRDNSLLQASVAPITTRTASIPVEWTRVTG
jgi:Family of unknown function (DUF5990)